MVEILKRLIKTHLRKKEPAPKTPYWAIRSYSDKQTQSKFCICATVDAGLIDRVVTFQTAVNNISMGWMVLPGSVTNDPKEAEKYLKRWKRSPRKLAKHLESKIY